jgi:hypothetical protein
MTISLTFQPAKQANPALAWASSLASAPVGRLDPHRSHNFIDIDRDCRRPLASAPPIADRDRGRDLDHFTVNSMVATAKTAREPFRVTYRHF